MSAEPSSSDTAPASDAAAAPVSTPTASSAPATDAPAHERDLGVPATAAPLQQPEAPASQSLPLPPLGAAGGANAAMNHSVGSNGEGSGLTGLSGGGTVGPGNRGKPSAWTTVAKKRLGGNVPPFYAGLSGVSTATTQAAAPLTISTMAGPTPGAPAASVNASSGLGNGNPTLPNGGPNPGNPAFPALHLHPLNDTFVPKQIALSSMSGRVKIGRQTNLKTVPNASNGFFDSKVLSRMHAEVWAEGGRIWIKDVKSSNGTFINGERLSPEGVESEAFELHTDDVVEFGIDIVSDDNKTIVHHKVAAKVFLVMSAEDAAASSREIGSYYRAVGEPPLHRRPSRAGAFAGGGFDHVLSRLQSELEKSRATGNDLVNLNTSMTDIQDTLSGGAGPPPPLPAPYQPGRGHQGQPSMGRDVHGPTLAAVQSQLVETQASLAAHMEKIRSLEGMLAEHEVIKREVGSLRSQMEEAKREMDGLLRARSGEPDRGGRVSPIAAMLEAEDEEDDSASVSSVDTVTLDSDLRASPKKSLTNGLLHVGSERSIPADTTHLVEQNASLASRLETLSSELDEATKLGQSLRSQHSDASDTIRALEDRVQGLEKEVDTRVSLAEGRAFDAAQSKFADWKAELEQGWRKQQEGWESERKKLLSVIQDWEERSASGSEGEARAGPSGKKNKRRRKRRAPSRLAELPMDDLASDSDSTAIVGSQSHDDLASKAVGTPGERAPSAVYTPIPLLTAAGGVVLFGIALAYAHKVKPQ